jgi:hypothetical protein
MPVKGSVKLSVDGNPCENRLIENFCEVNLSESVSKKVNNYKRNVPSIVKQKPAHRNITLTQAFDRIEIWEEWARKKRFL